MADQGTSLPGFGGLTRFREEYSSFINLKPIHVVAFIISIIGFRIFLGVYF